jgi:hypothetical protein
MPLPTGKLPLMSDFVEAHSTNKKPKKVRKRIVVEESSDSISSVEVQSEVSKHPQEKGV